MHASLLVKEATETILIILVPSIVGQLEAINLRVSSCYFLFKKKKKVGHGYRLYVKPNIKQYKIRLAEMRQCPNVY